MKFDAMVITYVFFVASFWLGALTQGMCNKVLLPCKRPLLVLAIALMIYQSGHGSRMVSLPENSEIVVTNLFAILWTVVVAITFLWVGFVAKWWKTRKTDTLEK